MISPQRSCRFGLVGPRFSSCPIVCPIPTQCALYSVVVAQICPSPSTLSPTLDQRWLQTAGSGEEQMRQEHAARSAHVAWDMLTPSIPSSERLTAPLPTLLRGREARAPPLVRSDQMIFFACDVFRADDTGVHGEIDKRAEVFRSVARYFGDGGIRCPRFPGQFLFAATPNRSLQGNVVAWYKA